MLVLQAHLLGMSVNSSISEAWQVQHSLNFSCCIAADVAGLPSGLKQCHAMPRAAVRYAHLSLMLVVSASAGAAKALVCSMPCGVRSDLEVGGSGSSAGAATCRISTRQTDQVCSHVLVSTWSHLLAHITLHSTACIMPECCSM